MSEVKTTVTTEVNTAAPERHGRPARDVRGGNRQRSRRNQTPRTPREFDSRMISVRRVSRSYKGGKRLRLSVCVVVGDYKGRVGIGNGKGADVKEAQTKAVEDAKKNMIMVQLKGVTIPHEVLAKFGASSVFMRPAAPGTGIIAGGSVRAVAELAGIKDILSKLLGSRNAINNAYVTIEALKSLRAAKL